MPPPATSRRGSGQRKAIKLQLGWRKVRKGEANIFYYFYFLFVCIWHNFMLDLHTY